MTKETTSTKFKYQQGDKLRITKHDDETMVGKAGVSIGTAHGTEKVFFVASPEELKFNPQAKGKWKDVDFTSHVLTFPDGAPNVTVREDHLEPQPKTPSDEGPAEE